MRRKSAGEAWQKHRQMIQPRHFAGETLAYSSLKEDLNHIHSHSHIHRQAKGKKKKRKEKRRRQRERQGIREEGEEKAE